MNRKNAAFAITFALLGLASVAEGFDFERQLNPSNPIIPLVLIGLGLVCYFFAGSYFEQVTDEDA